MDPLQLTHGDTTMMDTNEYDCWRAGEVEGDDLCCLDCGEPSDTDICGTCQEAYEMDVACRYEALLAEYDAKITRDEIAAASLWEEGDEARRWWADEA